MSQSDPNVNAALAAAQDRIRAAASGAVTEVANALLVLMKSAGTYRERGQLAFAQIHILESRELFLNSLGAALRDCIAEDTLPKGEAKPQGAKTDWQSISLVGADQIEERISFERIGQLITHRSEHELRELDGYMSSLLRHAYAEPDRNPLRGSVIGQALHQAIEKITDEPEAQKIFGRELGQAMANAMPACYREIIGDLKQRAVRPADPAVRQVEAGGTRSAASPGGPGFDAARKAWEVSWQGRIGADAEPLRSWEASILGRHSNIEPLPGDVDPEGSAALLDRLIRGGLPGSPSGPRNASSAEAEAELMKLLRRLNGGASYRGEFDALPRDTGYGSSSGNSQFSDFAPTTRSGVGSGDYYSQPPASGLSGLMAANIIRAHQAELMQASRGKLDNLVIEVVSSLFDQILSDARVPPQMARQIARLQLPVLRAALTDGSFFSSRRHPVRRFINRAASLACAFDSFESGPAKELLERIKALVTEIVEGDFDQLEVYAAKLQALEAFVAEQTHAEVRESPAAATLRSKELEWRVQQQFAARLRTALEPLVLPAFLSDFLSGVWGQAIVMATLRDGAAAPHPMQLRKTGAALVASIQPKRSLEDRKLFVATLPALMSALNEGIAFVGWPAASQDAFFGQLIAQHAGSLKGAPRSDLDHNMMLRHLEAAFNLAVPSADEAAREPEAPRPRAPDRAADDVRRDGGPGGHPVRRVQPGIRHGRDAAWAVHARPFPAQRNARQVQHAGQAGVPDRRRRSGPRAGRGGLLARAVEPGVAGPVAGRVLPDRALQAVHRERLLVQPQRFVEHDARRRTADRRPAAQAGVRRLAAAARAARPAEEELARCPAGGLGCRNAGAWNGRNAAYWSC